jgi:methionyl-tRNA formyltransferase
VHAGRPRNWGWRCAIPASLKGADEQAAFAALDADVAVVAAYGLILPQAVLDAPRARLHQRPRLAPAALARGGADAARDSGGRPETGVTIMQMEAGLDTGPMRAIVRTPVEGKTGRR